MHHEGEDAHLGGTAVVELDGGGALEVEGTHGRGGKLAEYLPQASSISAWRRPKPSSRAPMKSTIWTMPPKGMVSKAARPVFMSANLRPGAMSPPRRHPAVVTYTEEHNRVIDSIMKGIIQEKTKEAS